MTFSIKRGRLSPDLPHKHGVLLKQLWFEVSAVTCRLSHLSDMFPSAIRHSLGGLIPPKIATPGAVVSANLLDLTRSSLLLSFAWIFHCNNPSREAWRLTCYFSISLLVRLLPGRPMSSHSIRSFPRDRGLIRSEREGSADASLRGRTPAGQSSCLTNDQSLRRHLSVLLWNTADK